MKNKQLKEQAEMMRAQRGYGLEDPYLYPNSLVLKNKFNVRDSDLLTAIEADFTAVRLSYLAEVPLQGSYDLEHLYNIHHYIFQDIFEWAGKPRVIDMEKSERVLGGLSVEYSDWRNIVRDAASVLNDMKLVPWRDLGGIEKAEVFSKNLAELWKVHPFREGNTRTVLTFCCQFAESKGFPLNRSLLKNNATYVRDALVAANAILKDIGDKSQPQHLVKFVKYAIENDTKQQTNQKIKPKKSKSLDLER